MNAEANMAFGIQLREWRDHRQLSQLALSGVAGISSRHLSFLETGRSRPTEGMIIRVCEALNLPALAQNELFAAAGYTPRFSGAPAASLDDLDKPVRRILDLLLERHDPWPAACLDSNYRLLGGNRGFAGLAAAFDLAAGANMISLVVEAGPVREAIVNWSTFAPAFLRRVEAEVRFRGPRSAIARHLAGLKADPELAAMIDEARRTRNPDPYVELELQLAGAVTRWVSTITTLGTARDVVLEGIFIEHYFPADEETRAIAAKLV